MRLCCVKWHRESLCCSGIDLHRSYLNEREDRPKIKEITEI